MNEREYGPLTPLDYRPRLIEKKLDRYMQTFGCVVISGPKWCGKTWTALTRAASETKLDILQEKQAAEIDPALALIGKAPHLIDEWQEVPEIWDASRRFVDDNASEPGLLLLTGSSALSKEERKRVHHNGAGRIGNITMKSMSLSEMGLSNNAVSLKNLFDGNEIEPSVCSTSIEEISSWCCHGGWPGALNLPDDIASEVSVEYISASISENVVEEGKSKSSAMALLKAIAMNVSRSVTNKTLLADISATLGDSISEPTMMSYLDMLKRFYIVEEINGWTPPMRSKARVRVKPKRYFTDPSLGAALIGATPERLLSDMQTLGDLFENLVMRDLSVYLSTFEGLGNSLSYYRDDTGLEIDFIVEHEGKWGAIEVKLSDTKIEQAAKNLTRLRNKVCENKASRNAEPSFLAVVVGKGSYSYRREDGIYVIPIAALTA